MKTHIQSQTAAASAATMLSVIPSPQATLYALDDLQKVQKKGRGMPEMMENQPYSPVQRNKYLNLARINLST